MGHIRLGRQGVDDSLCPRPRSCLIKHERKRAGELMAHSKPVDAADQKRSRPSPSGRASCRLEDILKAAAHIGGPVSPEQSSTGFTISSNLSPADSENATSKAEELNVGGSVLSARDQSVESTSRRPGLVDEGGVSTGMLPPSPPLPPPLPPTLPPPSPPNTMAKTSHGRKRRECAEPGCSTRPSFAGIGEYPARCASHRHESDINVKHRPCFVRGCSKRSRFGARGSRPVHCIDHRQPGEIDPFRRPCSFPGCKITPTFSSLGKKPERCASHKIDGDVNTNRQKCGEPGCSERPVFLNSVTGVKHCQSHFTTGDSAGLRGMCQSRDPGSHVPCRKYATFSAVRGMPLRCKEHRLADDVDVLNRMCETESCHKRPSFAQTGGVAKRCKSHALPDDVNVTGKRRSPSDCDQQSSRKKGRG